LKFSNIDKSSMRESIFDTAIALPIAWSMSYLTLVVMYALDVSNAFFISLVQTIVLTVVSVFRKYTIRTKFKKAEVNLMKSQDSEELSIDIDHLDLSQRQEKYPSATN
tara:strand:- start:64 stop:387 length:324 start_codon:yes stop_codon:yes gene_type:complete